MSQNWTVDFIGTGPATRYVATTGSYPGNECRNQASPCATIAHAVSVANAGDTLNAAAGTYTAPGLIAKALIFVTSGVIFE